MTKQIGKPEYVTREILKEEIFASEKRLLARIDSKIDANITGLDTKVDNTEKRLDAKIETTAQSYKQYIDHRFNQLDTKMTKYFELMMQTITDGNNGINKILFNHEGRIAVLEGRGPQASRI